MIHNNIYLRVFVHGCITVIGTACICSKSSGWYVPSVKNLAGSEMYRPKRDLPDGYGYGPLVGVRNIKTVKGNKIELGSSASITFLGVGKPGQLGPVWTKDGSKLLNSLPVLYSNGDSVTERLVLLKVSGLSSNLGPNRISVFLASGSKGTLLSKDQVEFVPDGNAMIAHGEVLYSGSDGEVVVGVTGSPVTIGAAKLSFAPKLSQAANLTPSFDSLVVASEDRKEFQELRFREKIGVGRNEQIRAEFLNSKGVVVKDFDLSIGTSGTYFGVGIADSIRVVKRPVSWYRFGKVSFNPRVGLIPGRRSGPVTGVPFEEVGSIKVAVAGASILESIGKAMVCIGTVTPSGQYWKDYPFASEAERLSETWHPHGGMRTYRLDAAIRTARGKAGDYSLAPRLEVLSMGGKSIPSNSAIGWEESD